ncbi:MAG: hypothetical protein LUF79_02365 [Enterococcus sp.]|nr:hypothetical protein [Enterococcus sp.]
MSKREIRAKRLVAAVLLAISVQMWSAPPLWAAEASVQTETSAAGEAKETKDAKAADSETGGEADAGEEETVVVPVIGYSTRSAAGSDYGVMPLADMAVDGALTGVTGINGSELVVDKVNNNFFIGTIQDGGSFDKNYKNNAAIGLDIRVDQNGNNSVFGIEATGWGESVFLVITLRLITLVVLLVPAHDLKMVTAVLLVIMRKPGEGMVTVLLVIMRKL